MVIDVIAEKLESQGLWRRAAARWLTVMQSQGLTIEQRDWIIQHRIICLNSVKAIKPEKLNINILSINKAANATQKSMGIAKPNGTAFRNK